MAKKWTVVRLTSPPSLAVNVSEAKKHLRISETDVEQDDLIQSLVEAGIEKVQRDTGKQLVTCAFRQEGCSFGAAAVLGYGPVTRVTSVKYMDTAGNEQTLDPSVYEFDSGRQLVRTQYGEVFPEVADYPSAVKIEYVAGYGNDSGCIPRLFKNAVLLLAAQWFFDPAADVYASDANSNAYERIIKTVMRASYP